MLVGNKIIKIISDYILKEVYKYLEIVDDNHTSSLISSFDKHEHYSLNNAFNCAENSRLIEETKRILWDFFSDRFEENEFEFEDLETALLLDKSIHKDYLKDNELSFDKIKYSLLLVAFVNSFNKSIIHRVEEYYINSEQDINAFKTRNYLFYRGQCNKNWSLIPSALRNTKENVVFDNDYYMNKLEEYGLKKKYDEVIGASNEPLYCKYAFLQHSCSFSPLIDFTKKDIVAVSFALSNKDSFNDYHNNDSSVFLFGFDEEDGDVCILRDTNEASSFLKNSFKIYYINKNSLAFGETIDFNLGSIVLDSIPKTINLLKPRVVIIDIPTNDRMKYQKGSFACFYNCLCLSGRMCYELSNLKMVKLIIDASIKDNFLLDIQKNHREYDTNHILDPYLIFKE